MPTEIERKYLIPNPSFLTTHQGIEYRQGYLSSSPEDLTIVRVRTAGSKAYLTAKGVITGIVRREYEYSVPLDEANEMLDKLCRPPLIEKMRYEIDYGGNIWEVDVFSGDNQGLVVAEIELESETQVFELPPWVGEEVSHDPRYFNFNLARHPYKDWKEQKA